MLRTLIIKNIALITELSLDFSDGLNILSGETGAGKSIIIDSLNFVLGDRSDKSLIRYGEKSAKVQAVFQLNEDKKSELLELFDNYGIENDENGQVIVSRSMSDQGKGDCRVNGTLINISVLKKIVSLLVDIHSQHENQALLNEANHIKILDKYNNDIENTKIDYQKHFLAYKKAQQELLCFASTEERTRQIDVLEFQLAEIEKGLFYDGEEEDLIKERTKFYNSQKLIDALSNAISLLDGDDGFGAINGISNAEKELNHITNYDESYSSLSDRLDSTKIEIEDITATLKEEIEKLSFNPHDMELVEKRIDEIRKIKKRFGNDLSTIEKFKEDAEKQLFLLKNSEEKIELLNKTIEQEKQNTIKYAKKLHRMRFDSSKPFAKAIIDNITELGMSSSTFEVSFNYKDTDEDIILNAKNDGAEDIVFMISPNKGEPLKPLAKIASGGEMSRFMLGLKNITAELEGIDTLVFDEIDTGISGKIAKVVACKLYDIARNRQVLAVTHLPQLASMADTHYLIYKQEIGEKTNTFVEPLDKKASIKEIMRLSGSIENSESGEKNAIEMINASMDYKKSKRA